MKISHIQDEAMRAAQPSILWHLIEVQQAVRTIETARMNSRYRQPFDAVRSISRHSKLWLALAIAGFGMLHVIGGVMMQSSTTAAASEITVSADRD
jgi:hypothetical protein